LQASRDNGRSAVTTLHHGARALTLINDLARFTDEAGRLTRLYLSPAHRATAEATLALMRGAGLDASIDSVGNVVGRYEGATTGAPALIVGSHLDSVVDAGRYDGPLGVVTGILVVEELSRRGVRLPFAIEVVAFGDEENVRFPTNLSTSYALSGRYDPAWLDGRDANGITLRDALIAFGGDPDRIPALARRREDVVGYLELSYRAGPAPRRPKACQSGSCPPSPGSPALAPLSWARPATPARCRWRCGATRSRPSPRWRRRWSGSARAAPTRWRRSVWRR
jgi:allantoate deiminase